MQWNTYCNFHVDSAGNHILEKNDDFVFLAKTQIILTSGAANEDNMHQSSLKSPNLKSFIQKEKISGKNDFVITSFKLR